MFEGNQFWGKGLPIKETAMRMTSPSSLSVALLIFASARLLSQDDLAKNAKRTEQLKIVKLQGGFAGFTGTQLTITPDGSWTSEKLFNEKTTLKNKGKLSENDLSKLSAILEKYDIATLPAKSGKRTGANPQSINLQFGDKRAIFESQGPPKRDAKDPAGTVESRFAGIWEGVAGLLASQPSAKKKE